MLGSGIAPFPVICSSRHGAPGPALGRHTAAAASQSYSTQLVMHTCHPPCSSAASSSESLGTCTCSTLRLLKHKLKVEWRRYAR
jgi:hypothetical protein